MSTGAVWAWIFAILFIIVGIIAIHEHSVASSATATEMAAQQANQSPMIPAVTASTTTGY